MGCSPRAMMESFPALDTGFDDGFLPDRASFPAVAALTRLRQQKGLVDSSCYAPLARSMGVRIAALVAVITHH